MEPIRFEGAPWYDEMSKLRCTIVGVGATGSFAAFFLARLGIKNFLLVDPDTIETHNIGSQLYPFSEVGNEKVGATASMMFQHTTVTNVDYCCARIENIRDHSYSYDNRFKNSNIVLATADSMVARQYIFDHFKSHNIAESALFLDSRIGAEYWEVYAVPKHDEAKAEKYRQTLFSDDQGNTGACNYQQSSHSAAGAAICMAELVTQWTVEKLMEEDKLAFKTFRNIRINDYGCSY